MADVTTPKPYVLEYNPKPEPLRLVWAKVRPLEPADFDISAWTYNDWDELRGVPPCRVVARCRLTLRSEVLEEIKRIAPLSDKLFNLRNPQQSHRWGGGRPEDNGHWLSVDAHEPVKYQGAGTQESKRKRWQKAYDYLSDSIIKDGLTLIGMKIIEANVEILEYLEHQREEYIRTTLGWVTRISGYNIEEVDKIADNTALLAELPVLTAKIDGIEKAIHSRRVAVIKENWEGKDDCGYPEEVLTAVREALREPDAIRDTHVRVMWPVL